MLFGPNHDVKPIYLKNGRQKLSNLNMSKTISHKMFPRVWCLSSVSPRGAIPQYLTLCYGYLVESVARIVTLALLHRSNLQSLNQQPTIHTNESLLVISSKRKESCHKSSLFVIYFFNFLVFCSDSSILIDWECYMEYLRDGDWFISTHLVQLFKD